MIAAVFLGIIKYFPFMAAACEKKNFFFLPPWYEYLKLKKDAGGCAPADFNFPTDLLPVGLAVVDILIRLAGLLAIISIIIAGISYMTSGGSVDKAAAARKRIYNSLVGLAIVAIAAAVVAFIGNSLVG